MTVKEENKYCKMHDAQPLPEDIESILIEHATKKVAEANSFTESFNGHGGATVSFYRVPPEVFERIQDLLNKDPLLKGHRNFFIQAVTGGKQVKLHRDPPEERKFGVNYMLQPGGDNVLTRWYELTDENKDADLPYATPLDRDLFNEVECVKMEKGNWYTMDFNQAHSAENIEGLRLSLTVLYAE